MTDVKLVKYHGCGNDFAIVALQDLARILPSQEWPNFAKAVCHSHFGIGADGLLVVGGPDRSEEFGHVSMMIFNPDGSRAEMCGNGIRCVADYAVHQGWVKDLKFTIDTDAGSKEVEVVHRGYKVNMGPPEFDPDKIPMKRGGIDEFGVPWFALSRIGGLEALDSVLHGVSMGNPHAARLDESKYYIAPNLEVLGPQIESHPDFPNKTNVEFAYVVDEHRAKVAVWERGAGATLACGTGACAVAAVGIRLGKLKSPVAIELPGGTLEIEWDGKGDIYMTGPATRVAKVQYHYQGGSR